MSSNYPQPVKLFSFYNGKDKFENNFYIFGDNFFPRFDSHSSIINPPLDLMVGVDECLKKSYFPISACQWDVIAYIHKSIGMSLQQITDHADIVCYRGFLKDLALIPLGEVSKSTFVAFMYDEIIFIERVQTSKDPISRNVIEKEYMKKKLSKLCTISHGRKNPDSNSPVNFEEGFYVAKTRIFKTENSTIKVMFTGDVDAVDPNNNSKGNNFMKIKVCPGHIMHFFNGTALYKTWAQSYISGNDVIGAGIRKKTLVKEVKYVHVSELESKLPVNVPEIMEFVGKCLENIINICNKHPTKYIIIPDDKISLRVLEEETVKKMTFSRPTKAFVETFS